jgi:hypothetical protein
MEMVEVPRQNNSNYHGMALQLKAKFLRGVNILVAKPLIITLTPHIKKCRGMHVGCRKVKQVTDHDSRVEIREREFVCSPSFALPISLC